MTIIRCNGLPEIHVQLMGGGPLAKVGLSAKFELIYLCFMFWFSGLTWIYGQLEEGVGSVCPENYLL